MVKVREVQAKGQGEGPWLGVRGRSGLVGGGWR